MSKEDDARTIRRALEQAESMDDTSPVLDIVGGQPVTVTLKGWQWAGVTEGLRRLALKRAEVGGSARMVKDVTSYADQIEAQAGVAVNSTDSAVIARRLREAGYGS